MRDAILLNSEAVLDEPESRVECAVSCTAPPVSAFRGSQPPFPYFGVFHSG